jgi:hypothetical protein
MLRNTPKKGKELIGYTQTDNLEFVSWTQYCLTSLIQFPLDTTAKVHISIDQTNAAKYEQACTTIANILTEKKICLFKILWQSIRDSNIQGKEVTIYMMRNPPTQIPAPEENATFWIDLFSKIENELIKLGIKPNSVHTPGDRVFPGSKGYIFYRDPYNILQRYVASSALIWTGFTAEEAYRIGNDVLFSEWLTGKQLHSDKTELKEQELKALKEQELKEDEFVISVDPKDLKRISKKMVQDYFNGLNKTNDSSIPFAGCEVFLGSRSCTGPNDGRQENFAELEPYILHMFKLTPSKLLPQEDSEDFFMEEGGLQKVLHEDFKLFSDALELAAEVSAVIFIYFKNENNYPGNITPIIYYHLFLPYMSELIRTGQRPNLTSIIEDNQLVVNIIKASFRKPTIGSGENFTFAQIFHEAPVYICSLSDRKLDYLIPKALKVINDLKQRNIPEVHNKDSSLAVESVVREKPIPAIAKNAVFFKPALQQAEENMVLELLSKLKKNPYITYHELSDKLSIFTSADDNTRTKICKILKEILHPWEKFIEHALKRLNFCLEKAEGMRKIQIQQCIAKLAGDISNPILSVRRRIVAVRNELTKLYSQIQESLFPWQRSVTLLRLKELFNNYEEIFSEKAQMFNNFCNNIEVVEKYYSLFSNSTKKHHSIGKPSSLN